MTVYTSPSASGPVTLTNRPSRTSVRRARARFGIPANDATFLPLGNDSGAWAFGLASQDGAWFLKVVSRPSTRRPSRCLDTSHTKGSHISSPRSRPSAARYLIPGDPLRFILYPFVGGLDNDGPAFFAGYGQVQTDPMLIANYRFDWVVQELADYGKRVFLMPGQGDDTRAEAVDFFVGLFEPGEVLEAAYRADAALGL